MWFVVQVDILSLLDIIIYTHTFIDKTVPVIHCEYVLGHPAELHENVVHVWIVHYLEVFHRGLKYNQLCEHPLESH